MSDVNDAQNEMVDSLGADGILARGDALEEDINAQFEAWGNMRRVNPVQSLSSQD